MSNIRCITNVSDRKLEQITRSSVSAGNANSNGFQVLATDRVFSHDLLKTTQCLPLYRYTPDGERVSNITQWGLRQFREHYGDDSITAEDIFAYTYAMLHDPAYRQRLRDRPPPRVPPGLLPGGFPRGGPAKAGNCWTCT